MSLINKIAEYVKSNRKTSTVIVGSAVLVSVIIIVLAISLSGGDDMPEASWGIGITESVPEFSGSAETLDIASDGSYAAAYYNGVTTEQVNGYILQIEQECGVQFTGDKYPRSAVYGERIIAIHYNVTEMRFSVTVTQKNYS